MPSNYLKHDTTVNIQLMEVMKSANQNVNPLMPNLGLKFIYATVLWPINILDAITLLKLHKHTNWHKYYEP